MAIVSLLTSAAKLSLITAERRPREGDANPYGSPREQAGLEPSVPLESARSIWRTEPGGARPGSPRAPALTRVVGTMTGCSADRVHWAVNGRPPRSLKGSRYLSPASNTGPSLSASTVPSTGSTDLGLPAPRHRPAPQPLRIIYPVASLCGWDRARPSSARLRAPDQRCACGRASPPPSQ